MRTWASDPSGCSNQCSSILRLVGLDRGQPVGPDRGPWQASAATTRRSSVVPPVAPVEARDRVRRRRADAPSFSAACRARLERIRFRSDSRPSYHGPSDSERAGFPGRAEPPACRSTGLDDPSGVTIPLTVIGQRRWSRRGVAPLCGARSGPGEGERSVVCLGDALDDCQAEADTCVFVCVRCREMKCGNYLWGSFLLVSDSEHHTLGVTPAD